MKAKQVRAMLSKHLLLMSVMASVAFGLVVGIPTGRFVEKNGVPLVGYQREWAIGVFVGDSLFSVNDDDRVSNPVLTAFNVTDRDAIFVADPFIVREDGTWYMFFEAQQRNGPGIIGLATSGDGLDWEYRSIVLEEAFHLSYPYVFKWEGEYYMVPESGQNYKVRLYRAREFPEDWEPVETLLYGSYADPSLLWHGGRWWLFATTGSYTLRLYYADLLRGPWAEHPQSPIVHANRQIGRSGGRIGTYEGRLIRFAQDGIPTYGSRIHAIEITRLSPMEYEERLLDVGPILEGSLRGWNALGMHHIDPHRREDGGWVAAVDGWNKRLVVGLRE